MWKSILEGKKEKQVRNRQTNENRHLAHFLSTYKILIVLLYDCSFIVLENAQYTNFALFEYPIKITEVSVEGSKI